MSDLQQKEKLEIQLREAYGRVTYTYTSHLKFMNRLNQKNKLLRYSQITLSAISTGGFLGTFIFDKIILTTIAGLVSAVLLALNLFFKNFELDEESKQHRVAADKLWLIREKYVALLTDFETLSIKEIVVTRDILREETYIIYSESPKTDKKSYSESQKALKNEEEQFFTEVELDKMLPLQLRKN
ncbi:SLATT domain-containing protein, partial [Listeria monocytogenes]|nr:SLATT domain-containing protein [Listeria monocytogenes]EAG8494828.1 SLATT domain-containing protein [Listeria monocytogenes]EGC9986622.1 SLATT domain-containing protein [Listeria monocytogenes]